MLVSPATMPQSFISYHEQKARDQETVKQQIAEPEIVERKAKERQRASGGAVPKKSAEPGIETRAGEQHGRGQEKVVQQIAPPNPLKPESIERSKAHGVSISKVGGSILSRQNPKGDEEVSSHLLASIQEGGPYSRLWPNIRTYCRRTLTLEQFRKLQSAYETHNEHQNNSTSQDDNIPN